LERELIIWLLYAGIFQQRDNDDQITGHAMEKCNRISLAFRLKPIAVLSLQLQYMTWTRQLMTVIQPLISRISLNNYVHVLGVLTKIFYLFILFFFKGGGGEGVVVVVNTVVQNVNQQCVS
jgi:hypothetical protein